MCGSLSLYIVLRFWRSVPWFTSHPTLELGFYCVSLLGACFFALPPFSGARSEIRQLALCCQHVMLVCWLFLNFTVSFDFGCCSLAQEMCFVDHYLQQLITRPLPALLPFQSWFTESSHGDQLLAPPPFSSALTALCSLLFIGYFILFFLAGWWVSLCRGLCQFIPGVAVGIALWFFYALSVSPHVLCRNLKHLLVPSGSV
jgi:hypothetical protein